LFALPECNNSAVSPASEQQVRERHAARQELLLKHAAQIAQEHGLSRVTIGEVAARSGIGRSTVYSYFDSTEQLVADVIVDEMLEMVTSIKAELRDLESPRDVVLAWTRATLTYIADGGHKIVREAMSVQLDDVRRAQIAGLHRELAAPLMQALTRLGHDEPMRTAFQIQSLVDACVRRIESGQPADLEISATQDFILRGLELN
jgi:AcrR family transcriptional regulator